MGTRDCSRFPDSGVAGELSKCQKTTTCVLQSQTVRKGLLGAMGRADFVNKYLQSAKKPSFYIVKPPGTNYHSHCKSSKQRPPCFATHWLCWADNSDCHQEPQPPSCVCAHALLSPSHCRSHFGDLPKGGDKLQNKILAAPLSIDGCITSRTFMTEILLRIQDTVRGEWSPYRTQLLATKVNVTAWAEVLSCFNIKRPIIPK